MFNQTDLFVFMILFTLAIYVLNFLGVLLLLLVDRFADYILNLLFSCLYRKMNVQREYEKLDIRHEIVSSFSFTTCFMILLFFIYWFVRFEFGL